MSACQRAAYESNSYIEFQVFFLFWRSEIPKLLPTKTLLPLVLPVISKRNTMYQWVSMYHHVQWVSMYISSHVSSSQSFLLWQRNHKCCALTVFLPLPSVSNLLYNISKSSPHKSILGNRNRKPRRGCFLWVWRFGCFFGGPCFKHLLLAAFTVSI